MLSKHKVIIFQALCSILLALGAYGLKPYLLLNTLPQEESIHTQPILHETSTKTIWKRGRNPSTMVVEEEGASTNVLEKEHRSKGWTSIKWRSDDT